MNKKWNKLKKNLMASLAGEVRWDAGSRALYSVDASNYRQVPICVVIPKSIEDLICGVEVCNNYEAPILMRGGATSLAGQCCNEAVVFDTTKFLNHILEINPEQKTARVEPGVILDDLRKQCEKYNLTFGPDPATHSHCTLGGMIGNNSCGVHALMSGRTADNVQKLEILTYDGLRMRVGATDDDELNSVLMSVGRKAEIFRNLKRLRDDYAHLIRKRFPRIPRLVSGYPLDELLPEKGFHIGRSLVGTEGTCVTILEATLDLIPSPTHKALLVVGFKDVACAGDSVPTILEHSPNGLEGIDDILFEATRKKGFHSEGISAFPEGKGWLLVELGGWSQEEAFTKAHKLKMQLEKSDKVCDMHLEMSKEEQKKIWEIRESGLGTTAFPIEGKDCWPGWEDAAVSPDRVGDYLRDFQKLLNQYQYIAALYGHFGQGCIHTRIDFELKSKRGIKKYLNFINDASDLVIKYGGSLSGEHGDGQARGWLLEKMFGHELVQAFKKFKAIWDPKGKMNPKKVVDPYPIDSHLKLGNSYNPWQPTVHFHYKEDGGNFSHAALRCVGVGKCRRKEGGTMCPSFMVTGEEKHTTRGRAHALFEMLQGDVIKNRWRDKNVKETLDLCLACKGCKSDCPVNVDMATYKSEFFSHYYKMRLRPKTAYSMGFIDQWARMATLMPKIVNHLSQTHPYQSWLKSLGGLAFPRKIPLFANENFKKWFLKRQTPNSKGSKVLLWPDTFTNYFHPEIAKSATIVLEKSGFNVTIPRKHFCCGRPLYDFGWVERAKKYLQKILIELKEEIFEEIPIIVLEPSCLAVFRDELLNLLPHEENAKRLTKSVYSFSEFIENHRDSIFIPKWENKAILHGHCHQKALWKMTSDTHLLRSIGLDLDVLDSGCCGMAGSFGFEAEKYDVSIACGERVLLPAVRNVDKDTLVIADGFSCQEQIAQQTERYALHVAQVIALAMEKGK